MSPDVQGKKRALITDSGRTAGISLNCCCHAAMRLPPIRDITLKPLFTAAVSVGTSATSIGEFCKAAFGGIGLDGSICCHRSVSGVDSHYPRADSSSFGANLGWHPKITFSELVPMMVQDRSGL